MIYAIGVVRETTGEIGVRLLNPDKMQCLDVSQRDLSFYANRDGGIKNIEITKRGEVKWKQGAAERYPLIDKMTQQIRNENSVIVLGVADINGNKHYRICNYAGQIVNISAADLIQYGKVNKLANCKIVGKGNTEYIAAIEGNIEEISTKPKFRIDLETQCLIIEIPYMLSDELVIPDMINGRPMYDVESIKVEPASTAAQIKKLKLTKYIKKITSGLFYSTRNLEEITLYGDGIDIYDDTFILLKNLKKINVNRVRACGQAFCQGLKELEEFNCAVALPYIQSHTFSGCEKLKIETVLKEGVTDVYTKAFFGNKVAANITIPSSVRTISHNAFEKCKNIREVNVKTECLNVETGRSSEGKLFSGLGPIHMYVNKYCIIKEHQVAENVTIVRRESNDKDKLVERQVKKSSLLGINLTPDEVVSDPKDLANVISVVKQEELTNAVMSLINKGLKGESWWRIDGTFDLAGYKAKFMIEWPKVLQKATHVKNAGKYIAIMTNKDILFYPVDKWILKNYFEKQGAGGNRYYYSSLISPMSAERKYIKSIDIGEDGVVRLIYERDGIRKVEYLKDYKIGDAE